jgi:hypothetical protein
VADAFGGSGETDREEVAVCERIGVGGGLTRGSGERIRTKF